MENGSGSWDLLELGKWTSNSTSFPVPEGHGGAHQNQYQLHQYHHNQKQQQQQETTQHSHHHHLTCLKLGKRQYYGEAQLQQAAAKRKKATTSASSAAIGVVPRCQVEGCNKPLLDAKDYHRRHKVCELHSKSPKVVVLGAEQRFCQQCSRFHAITEFDDTKRSCRRRLAGHNERRRKSSSGAGGESITSNHHHHSSLENSVIGGCFPFLPPTSPGRALSLLSSKVSPWISTPELSSRSSAALLELIAENRAALLSRQLFSDRGWHNVGLSNQSVITCVPHQHQGLSQAPAQLFDGWNQFQDSGSHLTLDLMQTPNSTSFELLSRNKSKEDEEECCEIWKSPTLYEL